MKKRNVLIISGHPKFEESNANRIILEEIQARGENISVRHLHSLYPDYKIDVDAEQKALVEADIIVFQYPFYWYTVPGLLKAWMDEVFTFNFAYGPEGDKLKGKDFILSFTIGGGEESYHPLGFNHFPIEQFLYPFKQTAFLAGLNFQSPVYTHRMVYIPEIYNTLEEVEARSMDHADRLLAQLESLQLTPEDRIEAFVGIWFETFDALPENPAFFLSHMDQAIHWEPPEGVYPGKPGFLKWYEEITAMIKPGCRHEVNTVSPALLGEGRWKVDLTVSVEGEKMDGSPIAMDASETWELSIAPDGHIMIFEYCVR